MEMQWQSCTKGQNVLPCGRSSQHTSTDIHTQRYCTDKQQRLGEGTTSQCRRCMGSPTQQCLCQLHLETEKRKNQAREKQEAGFRIPQNCGQRLRESNTPQILLTRRSRSWSILGTGSRTSPGLQKAAGSAPRLPARLNAPRTHLRRGCPGQGLPPGAKRQRGRRRPPPRQRSPGSAPSHAPLPTPPGPPAGRGAWESPALPRAPGGPAASHAPRVRAAAGGGGWGCARAGPACPVPSLTSAAAPPGRSHRPPRSAWGSAAPGLPVWRAPASPARRAAPGAAGRAGRPAAAAAGRCPRGGRPPPPWLRW